MSDRCWISAAGRCPAAVTADTDDFAQSNLCIESREADAIMRERGHEPDFLAEVIKLEDHRVALAAVGARMRGEVVQYMSLGAQPPSAERFSGLRAVQITTRAKVLATASPASILTANARPRERHIRKQPLAEVTAAHAAGIPDGKAGRASWLRQPRAASHEDIPYTFDVANPDAG